MTRELEIAELFRRVRNLDYFIAIIYKSRKRMSKIQSKSHSRCSLASDQISELNYN